jgi:hypothetical protein
MNTHNFCYNFGFLADWFRANPKIKKYDVLHEMGMSDYKTLQNWIDGVTIMPTTQIMRFCNLYNVPITAFFFDENAEEDSVFSPIHAGATIEPVGGWKETTRRAGIKVCDPRTNIHNVSELPPYCKDGMITYNGDVTPHPTQVQTAKTNDMGYQERMHYLDIIDRLTQRITELSQPRDEKKQIINRYEHYGMAAEPEPGK